MPGKIDLESVRQLLALMSEHDLSELEIEQDDLVVRLRKGPAAGPAVSMAAMPAAVPQAAAPAPVIVPVAAAPELPAIKSPMVGTFYTASSPEAAAFVEVGDHVMEDSVVCVIEAMKVFNEIRAETSGTIEKVCVRNEQTVEFGTPLFIVRPD